MAAATETGAPPRSGWAQMVPELLVDDFSASLAFWCDVLDFGIAYQRPDEFFAYLERPEGAQVMLSYRHGVGRRDRWSGPSGAA